jgi:hypothetical protein
VTARDEAAYEDNTVNYLSLPAVEFGPAISCRHRHRNHPCARHRPDRRPRRDAAVDAARQRRTARADLRPRDGGGAGATAAFNILTPDGHVVDERRIECRAADAAISLHRIVLEPRGRARRRSR